MFDWARPKDASSTRKRHGSESEDKAAIVAKKMLPDSSDEDEDGSEDPIGDLLKSNTAIFSKSEEVLKSGTLHHSKLRNANAAS